MEAEAYFPIDKKRGGEGAERLPCPEASQSPAGFQKQENS